MRYCKCNGNFSLNISAYNAFVLDLFGPNMSDYMCVLLPLCTAEVNEWVNWPEDSHLLSW